MINLISSVTDTRTVFFCFWKALCQNPSLRRAILNYLLTMLPKLDSGNLDVTVHLPDHDNLVLTGLVHSVQDSQILVQRSALDLILSLFPLHNCILSTAAIPRLLTEVLKCIYRKEASLSRRVFNYLLGIRSISDSQTKEESTEYFLKYSQEPLIKAFHMLVQEEAQTVEDAMKPFNVLMEMLERPEIGPHVISDILTIVLQSLQKHKDKRELVSTLTSLLTDLKPEIVWDFMCKYLIDSVKNTPAKTPLTCLSELETVLDTFNRSDSCTEQFPKLLSSLITSCSITLEDRALNDLLPLLHLTLKTMGKILTQFNEAANKSSPRERTEKSDSDNAEPVEEKSKEKVKEKTMHLALQDYDAFFCKLVSSHLQPLWLTTSWGHNKKWRQGSDILLYDLALQVLVALHTHFKPDPTCSCSTCECHFSEKDNSDEANSGDIVLPTWLNVTYTSITSTDNPLVKALGIRAFSAVLASTPEHTDLSPQLWGALQTTQKFSHRKSGDDIILYKVRDLEIVYNEDSDDSDDLEEPSKREALSRKSRKQARTIGALPSLSFSSYIPDLLEESSPFVQSIPFVILKKLWSLFHPSLSVVHYTAARLFLELKKTLPEEFEAFISYVTRKENLKNKLKTQRRFTLIWRLTGEIGGDYLPFTSILNIMLDALSDTDPVIRTTARAWVADSLDKLERLLDPLFSVLLDIDLARKGFSYQKEFACGPLLVTLRRLKSLIDCDFQSFITYATEKSVSKQILLLNKDQVIPEDGGHNISDILLLPASSYLDMIVLCTIRFICGKPGRNASEEFRNYYSSVRNAATETLHYVLLKVRAPEVAGIVATRIQIPVLETLMQSIPEKESGVQDTNFLFETQLLNLLRTSISLAVQFSDKTDESQIFGMPLFKDAMIQGLTQSNSEFNIRFYWLEFIIACLPFMEKHLSLIVPVVHTLSEIIHNHTDVYDSIGTKDILSLLKALETILHTVLLPEEEEGEFSSSDSSTPRRRRRNIFSDLVLQPFAPLAGGYATGAHAVVTPPKPRTHVDKAKKEAREGLLACLPRIVLVLVSLWNLPSPNDTAVSQQFTDFSKEATHNKYALQDQITSILEPIMKMYPLATCEAFINSWSFDPKAFDPKESKKTQPNTRQSFGDENYNFRDDDDEDSGSEKGVDHCIYLEQSLQGKRKLNGKDIKLASVDILITLGTTNVVDLFESAQTIIQRAKYPTKSAVEILSLDFVYMYLQHTSSTMVLKEAWEQLLTLITQSVESSSPYTYMVAMHILIVFSKKAVAIKPNDRKDLQALTTKIVETLLLVATGSFRSDERFKAEKGSAYPSSGIVTYPFKSVDRRLSIDAQPDTSDTTANDTQICLFMLVQLQLWLPSLLRVVFGKEKMSPLVSSVISSFIPVIRARNHPTTCGMVKVIEQLCTMDELKSSLSHWQHVLDIFHSSDFFNMDVKQSKAWSSIIGTFYTTDTTLFPDFLKIFSRAPALFVNKQRENYNRAYNVKRLAFIIFSSKHDAFFEYTHLIQERLVDVLKSSTGPALTLITEYVFLVLRTLLLRTTPKKVEPFWPVILTEMMRIFAMPSPPPTLLLAVVKFLDLVLVLNNEQFNFWEWIFVPEKLKPVFHESGEFTFIPWIERFSPSQDGDQLLYQPLKQRPLINVQSLHEMGVGGFLSYLSEFSNLVYGNTVSGAPVDMPYIEKLIRNDFLGEVEEEQK
eukprot:TRINITY_DN5906_c0_g1_i1.p1 TRINITY_DN5906_c0_g1~~TRINITY_DN5906_c0_g1_i1.p1  ORF type:complete len:1867 (-),score=303.28 TRINITY_DN5906_c0_g1_i1:19-5106(-)